MSVRRFAILVQLGVVALVPAVAFAQHSSLRSGDDEAGAVGITFYGAAPWGGGAGSFRPFTDFAPGAGLSAIVNLGSGSPLAIRLDAAGVIYGSGYQPVPQAGYPLSLQTTNGMGTLGIGPQLTIGGGPIRLYGFATFGASYISTWSSYQDGGCGCAAWGGGTTFSDWAAAYRAGGGLLLRMGGRRSSTMLDLGAGYLHNNAAWYVVPGSVATAPDGSLRLATAYTPLNFVTFHVGISVILR